VTSPYEKNAPDAETQVRVFSAGNSIYVQNVGSADGECREYDIAGHYLMKVPFSSNNVTTITNSLRPGAYIAMAIAGGEKVSKRLIVQ
ncbi:MAG: T9SS type A sorting domain-containing protein, partial [Paludibacter sp.]|nr:T9SS type A sorting domain-containing protein [Paludibacter sp.]